MDSIINYLKQLFSTNTGISQGSRKMMTQLMDMLEKTNVEEYSCDEVYDLVDQYAELMAKGEDAAHMMPLIKHHLDMCIDCREEYESLLSILNSASS